MIQASHDGRQRGAATAAAAHMRVKGIGAERRCYKRSITAAMPWPPPMHMVTSP